MDTLLNVSVWANSAPSNISVSASAQCLPKLDVSPFSAPHNGCAFASIESKQWCKEAIIGA